MKNKKLLSSLALIVVAGSLVACKSNEVAGFDFDKAYLLSVEKFKAENGSLTYLEENGKTVTFNDPSDPNVNPIKELVISQPVVSIYYSDSKTKPFAEQFQLTASPKPANASAGKLTWSTSDAKIAAVDENGLVTAVGSGTALITVTSATGLTATSRVVVCNNNVTLNEAVKSGNKIVQVQGEADFETPTTVYVREDYVATKTIDGVVQSRTKFAQQMWASIDQSYFRIVSDDEEQKTAGGSVVPSNDQYVFYTTEDYLSYVFCLSNNKTNYMRLNQAFLVDEGKTPYNGLEEILQSFFVSGSKIMTSQFEDVLGAEYITDKDYQGAKYKGSFGEDSGVFAFDVISTSAGKVSPSQESDMGIPAGTYITITDDIRYLWEDNLMSARLIDEKLEYEIDGKQYVERYVVNYYYQGRNVELYWPEVSNFTQVDSIFDL